MDAANKLLGKPTHYWIQSEEWTSAYKQTLSKSKQNEFDKEWDKLEDEHRAFQDAPPKKQAGMTSPLMKGY